MSPIYKKGDKTNPYNYRPISLTRALYRTFERILAKHIVEFLHKKKFFSNEQFGFLKNRSTSTQLLTVLDEFYLAIEKGEKVDVVYIDFKRVFDTVPISGLKKVKEAGINGKIFDFIRNFLTNRTYTVKINDKFSKTFQVSSGVPQGSVRGPILFTIFINDLPTSIPKEISCKLYADDVKLLVRHNNDGNRETLNESLKVLQKWTNNNGLEIAKEKCFVVYIGKNNSEQFYEIGGNLIEKREAIRDLGILLDKDLKFNQHINQIVENAYFKMFQLLKVLKTNESRILIDAYKAYIRPQLEYASEVWNPYLKMQMSQIEKVQKFFTRRLLVLKRIGQTKL